MKITQFFKKSKEAIVGSFINMMALGGPVAALATAGGNSLNKKRKGAFAFEYIIVLVLMVSVIIIAWNLLGDAVDKQANNIADTINGVDTSGGGRWGGK